MTVATELEIEPVIGLEVHAQLLTESKMFCGCSARYVESGPNTHVCAVCGGMPGALPVINARAVEYTVMTALALHCRVEPQSKFDRKNYPYADLPKGYQISQYDMPIGQDGWLEFPVDGETHRCGIVRVHLEEDTGKTTHTTVDGREVSLVDYNRSGVPLMEIVSQPDLRSPEEAERYFAALRQLLMYLGVCDGNLQEGSMRADVNVSVRRRGAEPGTKVEIKNLNSFRAVQRSLRYEIERQTGLLIRGESVAHETRGWSEEEQVTLPQRTKEYAHDYRYFPEPDLPALVFASAQLDALGRSMPELPDARRNRFGTQYGLAPAIAELLTAERERADFYEEAARAAAGIDPGEVAKWVAGEVLRLEKADGVPLPESRLRPAALATLLQMMERGEVSGTAAKHVLEEVFETGEDPEAAVRRLGLQRIGGAEEIDSLTDDVIANNGSMVEQYRSGKAQVLQALIGRAMGASKGKADPELVRDALLRKLAAPQE